MDWRPQSPGLNIIESAWDHFYQRTKQKSANIQRRPLNFLLSGQAMLHIKNENKKIVVSVQMSALSRSQHITDAPLPFLQDKPPGITKSTLPAECSTPVKRRCTYSGTWGAACDYKHPLLVVVNATRRNKTGPWDWSITLTLFTS